MQFGAYSRNSFRQRRAQRFVAVVGLLLVCLFAGFTAAHQHALNDTPGFSSSKPIVCELCANAYQAVLVLVVLLSVLYLLLAEIPANREIPPPHSIKRSPLFSRPPPVLA